MQGKRAPVLLGHCILGGTLICLLLLPASCISSTKDAEKSRRIYPEAAFDRLCEAYQREDYNAIYDCFSSESKRKLAESREGIKNAADYRMFISPAMDALKQKANGARIIITLKMGDYAQGIIRWSDGIEQDVWFTRENGIWKMDLAFEGKPGEESPGPESAP